MSTTMSTTMSFDETTQDTAPDALQPVPPATEGASVKRLITASALKAFRACQRKHHYRYTLGVRPLREPTYLTFGSLIHAGLEAYWLARGGMLDTLEQRFGSDARQAAESDGPGAVIVHEHVLGRIQDVDAFDRARATAMLHAYAAAWGQVPVDVLGVEVEFRFPLVNPETGRASTAYDIGGKIDAIVRLEDGRLAVIEHKSSSEDLTVGGEYHQRLTLDGQVSQYFEGGDALAAQGVIPDRIDLVIYDVLAKPKIRPARATPVESRKYTKDGRIYANQRETDETVDEFEARCAEAVAADPGAYVVRYDVHRFDAERDEYRSDLWLTKDALLAVDGLVRKGRTPPKNPDACFRFGSACEFLGVCQRRASLDDVTQFRRTRSAHEELSAVA